jgi:hypothetical protein
MGLLALGTFLWAPSWIVLVGAVLIGCPGDLRAGPRSACWPKYSATSTATTAGGPRAAIPGLY